MEEQYRIYLNEIISLLEELRVFCKKNFHLDDSIFRYDDQVFANTPCKYLPLGTDQTHITQHFSVKFENQNDGYAIFTVWDNDSQNVCVNCPTEYTQKMRQFCQKFNESNKRNINFVIAPDAHFVHFSLGHEERIQNEMQLQRKKIEALTTENATIKQENQQLQAKMNEYQELKKEIDNVLSGLQTPIK